MMEKLEEYVIYKFQRFVEEMFSKIAIEKLQSHRLTYSQQGNTFEAMRSGNNGGIIFICSECGLRLNFFAYNNDLYLLDRKLNSLGKEHYIGTVGREYLILNCDEQVIKDIIE